MTQQTFSVSELKTFKSCRYEHYVTYKLRKTPRYVNLNFYVGTAFHDALELYYAEKLPLKEAIEKSIKKNLELLQDRLYFNNALQQAEEVFEASQLLYVMAEHFQLWMETQEEFGTDFRDSKYKSVVSELDFEIELNGVVVRLRIDGVLQDIETGEYFVHEIKTTKSPNSFDAGLFRDIQPVVYKAALSKHLGVNVSGVIYTLAKKKIPTVSILKSGELSIAANQDTSPEWFLKVLKEEFGEDAINITKYAKYLYLLRAEKPNQFFTRFIHYVSDEDVELFWEQNSLTIAEMNGEYVPTAVDSYTCDHCSLNNLCYQRLVKGSQAAMGYIELNFIDKE